MKAAVTGAGGQVATEWVRAARPGWTVTALGHGDLDIGDRDAVDGTLAALRPEVIVNAAAFTAVDRAETEPATAWRVNCEGAGHLARAATGIGARLVHLSTDYVFDGAGGRAYGPDDPPAPLNVYGASKLAGEAAVLAAAPGALIVRTAWVYSAHGANFLTTMLDLMDGQDEVRVVADQIGAPTSAASLASALWDHIEAGAAGVCHYTDAGVASWYDFAAAIGEEAFAVGLLARPPRVIPINTSDRPTVAARPAFSVLDTSRTRLMLGRAAPHWREALREVLAGMRRRP